MNKDKFIFINAEMKYLAVSERQTRAAPVKTYAWVDNTENASIFNSDDKERFNRASPYSLKWDRGISPAGEIIACARVDVIYIVRVKELKGI